MLKVAAEERKREAGGRIRPPTGMKSRKRIRMDEKINKLEELKIERHR